MTNIFENIIIQKAKDGDVNSGWKALCEIHKSLSSKSDLSSELRNYLKECLGTFIKRVNTGEVKGDKQMQGSLARSFHLLGREGNQNANSDEEYKIFNFIYEEMDDTCIKDGAKWKTQRGKTFKKAHEKFLGDDLAKNTKISTEYENIHRIYYKWRKHFLTAKNDES